MRRFQRLEIGVLEAEGVATMQVAGVPQLALILFTRNLHRREQAKSDGNSEPKCHQ